MSPQEILITLGGLLILGTVFYTEFEYENRIQQLILLLKTKHTSLYQKLSNKGVIENMQGWGLFSGPSVFGLKTILNDIKTETARDIEVATHIEKMQKLLHLTVYGLWAIIIIAITILAVFLFT